MKRRKGLVSNSSTSSFCIYGIRAEEKEFGDAAAKTETGLRLLREYADNYCEGDLEIAKNNAVEALDLTYGPDYSDYAYCGLDWTSVRDDETGAQFKARARAMIADLFGEEMATGLETWEEAWRDG